jgi:hypothetical protein
LALCLENISSRFVRSISYIKFHQVSTSSAVFTEYCTTSSTHHIPIICSWSRMVPRSHPLQSMLCSSCIMLKCIDSFLIRRFNFSILARASLSLGQLVKYVGATQL